MRPSVNGQVSVKRVAFEQQFAAGADHQIASEIPLEDVVSEDNVLRQFPTVFNVYPPADNVRAVFLEDVVLDKPFLAPAKCQAE